MPYRATKRLLVIVRVDSAHLQRPNRTRTKKKTFWFISCHVTISILCFRKSARPVPCVWLTSGPDWSFLGCDLHLIYYPPNCTLEEVDKHDRPIIGSKVIKEHKVIYRVLCSDILRHEGSLLEFVPSKGSVVLKFSSSTKACLWY